MTATSFSVRPEISTDRSRVFQINERAFGRPDEARIVDAVRDEVKPCISLVASVEGHVVGHALFTPVTVDSDDGDWTAMALGPIAVDPEHQRRGAGTALIEAGLDVCRRHDQEVIFVVGDPAYYTRFGFGPTAPRGLSYPSCPADALMVIELREGALAGRTGVVVYRPEFEGV